MTDQNTNQNTARRRGTSPASDPLPEGENNAIGGLLIRGHDGQSINWSASIQGLFSNLSQYLDLFIKALTDPVGYEKLARAMGIKTAANNEPARSTHGDRNVRPTQPEEPSEEAPEPETPEETLDQEISAEEISEPLTSAPEEAPEESTAPETQIDSPPIVPEELPVFDPYKIEQPDEHRFAGNGDVADDVFERSPALAAASLKFNTHFEAAVAGPQAQEPSMALDLTNLPTLGRVA
jgi:hypothetical protein